MSTQTVGRATVMMVGVMTLLLAILVAVPGPMHVIAALLSLPVGALLFASGPTRG